MTSSHDDDMIHSIILLTLTQTIASPPQQSHLHLSQLTTFTTSLCSSLLLVRLVPHNVAQRELHTIKGEIIRIETGTIICLLASKVNIDKNILLFIFSANVFHQMKVQPLAFKKNLYRIINMLTHHFLKLTWFIRIYTHLVRVVASSYSRSR